MSGESFTIDINGSNNDSNLVLSSGSASIHDQNNKNNDVSLNLLINNMQSVLTHLNSLVSTNAKTTDLTNLATTSDLTNLAKTTDLIKLQTLEKLMNLELKTAQLLNSYTTNSMKPLKAIYLTNIAGIVMEREPAMGFFSKNMFWSQVYNSMKLAANNFNIDLSIRGPGEDMTDDKDLVEKGIQWGIFGRSDLGNAILDKLLDMENNEEQLPDIFVYSNFNNDICLNKIKQLSDYGVDVYSINQNLDDSDKMGASYYIGANDASSSVILSQYLKNTYNDISNVIILNTAKGAGSSPSFTIRETGIRSVFTDISVVSVAMDVSQTIVNADLSNALTNLQGNNLAIFVGADPQPLNALKLYSSHFKYWGQFDIPSSQFISDLSDISFAGCISQNQHLQGFLPLMIARSKFDEYYKDPSNSDLINLKLPPGFPTLSEQYNFINKLPTGNIVNTAGEIISSMTSDFITKSSSLYV